MRMRKCANCGHRYPINETRCPECDTHNIGGKSEPDRIDPRCAWNANGLRCKYPGTISDDTLGKGPWYCSLHYGTLSARQGEDVVRASQSYLEPASHGRCHPLVEQARDRYEARVEAEIPERIRKMSVAECRAEIKRLLPGIGKKIPSTQWAVRILDRLAAGEKLPIISERLAREALNIPASASAREPGQDEEERDATVPEAL